MPDLSATHVAGEVEAGHGCDAGGGDDGHPGQGGIVPRAAFSLAPRGDAVVRWGHSYKDFRMRMAFGLVSLLVTLAVILMFFKSVQAPMLKEGKKAQDQARQMAGRDEDGERVTNAVTLDAQDRGGKMEGVIVTDIKPNSALQQRYGLQKGDVILEMGPLSVRGNMSSPDEAKDMLQDAFQKDYNLVVVRGWDRLTLPMPEGAAPAPTASAGPAGAPAYPTAGTPAPSAPGAQADASPARGDAKTAKPAAPRKDPPKSAMERQLDLIRNIPGQ